MRPDTEQNIKDSPDSSHRNVIRETRKIIKGMT
jgi:hypothetical protein